MKVALVSEWLDPWRGGAETSTLQFLHHLMDAGVEVHVITRSRPAPTPGLFVHCVAGASMSRMRNSVTFAHRVSGIIREGSFDVVHAISPCRGADVYQPRGGTVAETIERNVALRESSSARRLKRYSGRLNLKQRYLLRAERKLFSGDGPVVVAISDYVARQLREHYSLPADRVHRIYNGVDADPSSPAQRSEHRRDLRTEFRIAPDDLLVIVVAHNFRLKGVKRWMEALAMLLARGTSNVKSLALGRGDSPRWHRLADKLGLGGRLTFVGATDRVRAFFHAADVLVHPTYYDPCSRVVLEGMTSGLACITTRWDGASEMIQDGLNGFVLDEPTEVETLADIVDRLRREPALRRRIGAEAAKVAEAVSMGRHAKEMLALYEKLAAVGVAQ
jgi:UDP-glucose:(heptosyl)LPS alpha-1,3-glucosyltransferase